MSEPSPYRRATAEPEPEQIDARERRRRAVLAALAHFQTVDGQWTTASSVADSASRELGERVTAIAAGRILTAAAEAGDIELSHAGGAGLYRVPHRPRPLVLMTLNRPYVGQILTDDGERVTVAELVSWTGTVADLVVLPIGVPS